MRRYGEAVLLSSNMNIYLQFFLFPLFFLFHIFSPLPIFSFAHFSPRENENFYFHFLLFSLILALELLSEMRCKSELERENGEFEIPNRGVIKSSSEERLVDFLHSPNSEIFKLYSDRGIFLPDTIQRKYFHPLPESYLPFEDSSHPTIERRRKENLSQPYFQWIDPLVREWVFPINATNLRLSLFLFRWIDGPPWREETQDQDPDLREKSWRNRRGGGDVLFHWKSRGNSQLGIFSFH